MNILFTNELELWYEVKNFIKIKKYTSKNKMVKNMIIKNVEPK